MNKSIKFLLSTLSLLALTGCDFGGNAEPTFGDFGHKGVFLKEYATKQINVVEAKGLIDIAPQSVRFSAHQKGRVNEENLRTVLTKYSALTATVKYYVSGTDEQQVRRDIYQGTDFKYLLESNHYEPFGQMSVRYLYVDDELLDDLERENEEFKNSGGYMITPFNEIYTYHTNEDKHLILQTHSFAELPASTGGGIGSTFRQDCELIFDEEGKITFWQSSLGLYTSTPTGTVKEGYIFEVNLEWTEK